MTRSDEILFFTSCEWTSACAMLTWKAQGCAMGNAQTSKGSVNALGSILLRLKDQHTASPSKYFIKLLTRMFRATRLFIRSLKHGSKHNQLVKGLIKYFKEGAVCWISYYIGCFFLSRCLDFFFFTFQFSANVLLENLASMLMLFCCFMNSLRDNKWMAKFKVKLKKGHRCKWIKKG